ncbi:hypothetical protein [Pedobacter sp. R20-19]|uniref:hypothetical protein n=1 Tax=Pedobacter sp. R20-19 TaxID=1270196 RepID=UPI000493A62B|nr:hypothetical protein [Pedobacter sp. R20-19]
MEKIFDCLIDSYIKEKVGVTKDFLSLSLATNLKENLLKLFKDQQLLSAGIGNNLLVNQDKLIRSDVIYSKNTPKLCFGGHS